MPAYKGLIVPSGTDPANVPDTFRDFVDSLDQVYGSTALADAAGVPDNYIVTVAGVPQYRNGGSWRRVALFTELPDELRWRVTGASIAGSAATGGGDAQRLRMQAGSNVITTNTSGSATISFPEAFSGVASVLAQVGDTPDPVYTHLNGVNYPDLTVGNGNLQVVTHGHGTTSFQVRLYSGGGNSEIYGPPFQDVTLGGCGPVRINWMAFGW